MTVLGMIGENHVTQNGVKKKICLNIMNYMFFSQLEPAFYENEGPRL